MSEMYEGVAFRSDARTARRIFHSLGSALHLKLVRLARGVFGIYRVAGRADAFDQEGVESVARQTSAEVGNAVALFYDNSCGVRVGVLYSDGRRKREFGDGDAWWVPFGADGEPVTNGPRFRVSELQRGVEYDCIFTAIDAGLQAVEAGPSVSESLITNTFCYEGIEALAESGNP